MTFASDRAQDIAADRFGVRVATHLTDLAEDLPHDVTERLRVARLQAIDRRHVRLGSETARSSQSSGATVLTLSGGPGPLWGRLVALLPLLALVFGVYAIDRIQSENRANELAEIDVAILTDDLPPSAYADPGFAQFLKLNATRAP